MASANPARRPTSGAFGVRVDDALEAVLRKALAVTPRDRYATAGEFWQAVRSSQNMPALRAMSEPNPKSSVSTAVGVGADATVQAPPAFSPPRPSPIGSAPTELGTSAHVGLVSGRSASPLADGGPSTRDPVASTNAPSAPARSKGGAIAAAVLGVLALGGSGFLWMARGSSAPVVHANAVASAPVPLPSPSVVAARKECPAKMARIDGGKFFMGSDESDADPDERPAHQVTLSPYCIDLYEVTAADYKGCSDVGECKRAPFEVEWKDIRPNEKKAFSPLCTGSFASKQPEKAKHPINCVDWNMATIYCAWEKKRLPTEAEWEFAARGPDGRRYPWGDEPPDKTRMNACGRECLAWGAKNGVEMGARGKGMFTDDDGFPTTAPVGSFPAGNSRYGLFDVVGNVWEWTSDWDGKYAPDPVADPTGPKTGERRVVRGGAFNGALPSWVRPSQRYSDFPNTHSHAYGFRCAQSL